MRKIGINLGLKRGIDLVEYVKKLHELGINATFSGVPAVKQIKEIRKVLEEYGIEWETLHAPFGHINDIWLEGEAGDIMLRELMNCVDSCVLAGARIAVVHLSAGEHAPSITDIGRRRFTELVEYAATKNIMIAFENQRKLANLAWAMEAFPEGSNVGFCWDCGHESCFTQGREYMPLFGKRLICTHIHDNHGVFDEDDHMIPFDATMDYERFAQHIRESGYEGSLMLEVGPGHEMYHEMSWETFAERAAAAVKRLREMVDGKEEDAGSEN